MLRLFAKRSASRALADRLYRAIVARARHPGLYAGLGVADTLDGRFEMLMLHVIVLVRRLRADGAGELAQRLFDVMFADMDQALRELGVGDLAVPKRIRTMAEAYYGRSAAYEVALGPERPAEELVAVVARNAFPDGHAGGAAERLAGYVRQLAAAVGGASVADIAAGQVDWPDPAAA